MARRPGKLALVMGLVECAWGCNGDLRAYFAADVVDTVKDVPYIEHSDNPRQQLDLYTPRGAEGFPVVVFVHGGYWVGQDKDYYAPFLGLYGNVGRALAKLGIGCAVINYRLVPDVTFEQQLSDVSAAVKWTHTHIESYGGDRDRLVLAGHSAGGHMTALLAFDRTRLTEAGVEEGSVSGFAPLSPIFDLEHMAAHPPEADFNQRITETVFGHDLRKHSPNTYFAGIQTPLFVAMGERDESYLVDQIPRAVADLRRLGANVTFEQLGQHSHSDVVVNFETADDRLSEPLAEFVHQLSR